MRNLQFADVTLRMTGARPEGAPSFKEKIGIAKLLDRLAVPVIETPPITDAQVDALVIKTIANLAETAAVSVPVGLSEEGVARAWEAVKGAKHPRLQVIVPTSPVQMEYGCHKKPPMVLEMIAALVTACRARCAEVEFVADDATRAEPAFLRRAIAAAAAAGASVITLCDAAGASLPEEFAAFFSAVRAEVPEAAGCAWGVQCSDGLKMALACAVAAVRAGADEVKVTADGGDCPALDALSQIVRSRGDACGVYSDLRVTELQRAVSQIRWMTEPGRSASSPFDGNRAAAAPAGGELGAHDDRESVGRAVRQLGYDLSEEDMAKVYEAFVKIAEKKTVSPKELDVIVASNALQVPPSYQLQSYLINSGNVITPIAHLKLEREGETLQGICAGDGPIDAAFLAIEQAVGHHYELDDYQIQAVTEGREAMGAALIRLRSGGKLYSGQGISTDVIGASIQAYLNALNKIVYEEM